MFCEKCGAQLEANSTFCASCGSAVATTNNNAVKEEGSPVGWAILSFLIPLVGLILFITWKDSKPKTAKVCGIAALVGFVLNLLLSIISIASGIATVRTTYSSFY